MSAEGDAVTKLSRPSPLPWRMDARRYHLILDADENLVALVLKREDAAFIAGLVDLLERAAGDNARLRLEVAQARGDG